MDDWNRIGEQLIEDLVARNRAREQALLSSRELVRFCANAIRAVHREEKAKALELLDRAHEAANALRSGLADFLDLYHAGYTQDAMKEYAEACLTYAIVHDEPWPSPQELKVETMAYLQGMAEAAGELRRRILDIIRHGRLEEAERILDVMEDIYSFLITVDFPNALTGGLRRLTDMVRGVLERTRGDLTMAMRQQALQQALRNLEERLDAWDEDKQHG